MEENGAKKWYFRADDEGLTRRLQDGVVTRIFFSQAIMLSLAEIAPHTISTIHSHPEEQWGYLLEGECVRVQDGEEVQMKQGDFWRTPAHTLHGVRTGEKGVKIMDIFSPPRSAYKERGEGFAMEHVPAPEKTDVAKGD